MVYESNAKRSPEMAILEIADDVHQIAVGNTLPVVDSGDNGDIMMVVEGEWAKASAPTELPAVSGSDNGDVLTVVSGAWAKATPPEQRTYYTITVVLDGTLTEEDIDAPADIEENGVACIGITSESGIEEESCSCTGASMGFTSFGVIIFNPTGNVTVTLSNEA